MRPSSGPRLPPSASNRSGAREGVGFRGTGIRGRQCRRIHARKRPGHRHGGCGAAQAEATEH